MSAVASRLFCDNEEFEVSLISVGLVVRKKSVVRGRKTVLGKCLLKDDEEFNHFLGLFEAIEEGDEESLNFTADLLFDELLLRSLVF